jgi:hypothetical protein
LAVEGGGQVKAELVSVGQSGEQTNASVTSSPIQRRVVHRGGSLLHPAAP